MKRYYLLLLIMFFVGCEDRHNLKGHILYHNEGVGFRMIMSQNPLRYRISVYPDVVDFVNDSAFTLVKQVPSPKTSASLLGEDLYSMFNGYKYAIEDGSKDSVVLNPYNKWAFAMFSSRNASDSNTSRDLRLKEIVGDSLIKNDPYFIRIFSKNENFWIILNKHDSLIGPLTKAEYLKMRQYLRVPEKLRLKSENE